MPLTLPVPLGRVLDAVLQALDVLGAVGGEQAGARVDDADVVVLESEACLVLAAAIAMARESANAPTMAIEYEETTTHALILPLEQSSTSQT